MTEPLIEEVLANLSEAIAWCAPRANPSDPENSLRTPELRPSHLSGNRVAEVNDVVVNRQVALRWPKRSPAAGLSGGRLLGYEPDQNLADGATEFNTSGFFDADNVPPWDTWVAYVEEPGRYGYLVSWIPPLFLDLVQKGGIEVVAEDCIWWIDTSDTQLAAQLRAVRIV